jgi:hypothetical protein
VPKFFSRQRIRAWIVPKNALKFEKLIWKNRLHDSIHWHDKNGVAMTIYVLF